MTVTTFVQEQLDDNGDILFAVHTPRGLYTTHSRLLASDLLERDGVPNGVHVPWYSFDEGGHA